MTDEGWQDANVALSAMIVDALTDIDERLEHLARAVDRLADAQSALEVDE